MPSGKMAKAAVISIVVGTEFSSFIELQHSIRQYELHNFVELYVSSSRTIQAMKKRAPKKSFCDELQFGDITYACRHGGRNYKTKSAGARLQQ